MPMLAEMAVDSDVDAIEAAISGLANAATQELLANPGELPSLYDAAARGLVVYRKEDPDAQTWLTPRRVLERGWGDCKHFSAWRVAELRAQRRKAMVAVIDRRDSEHPGRFHAVVEHDGGELEDPSLIVIDLERRGPLASTGDANKMRTTSVKIRRRGRHHVAEIGVPLFPSHSVTVACAGDTKADALDRASSLAQQLSADPVVAALMPPQAGMAIDAAQFIAKAARSGRLGSMIDSITGDAKKAIAKVLAEEYKAQSRDARGSVGAIGMRIISQRGNTCVWQAPNGTTYTGQCNAPPTNIMGQSVTAARPSATTHPLPTRIVGPGGTVTKMPGGPSASSRAHGFTPSSSSSSAASAQTMYGGYGGADPYGGYGGIAPGMPGVGVDQQGNPTSNGWTWVSTPAPGHWERITATGSNVIDPSTGQPYQTDPGVDPLTGMPYGQEGYGPYSQGFGDGWGNPYGPDPESWDPWLYPGQQPFASGWSPFAPAANTSTYPSAFEGGPGMFAPTDEEGWWTQQGAEALFNGGAWYPPDDNNWAYALWPTSGFTQGYGPGAGGFPTGEEYEGMSDVSDVGDPQWADGLADVADVGCADRAELLACAQQAGWSPDVDVMDSMDLDHVKDADGELVNVPSGDEA